MGGPWTNDGGHKFRMHGPDKDFYIEPVAGIVGRGMYDAAGAWGGTNPFAAPFVVLYRAVPDCHRGLESRSLRRSRYGEKTNLAGPPIIQGRRSLDRSHGDVLLLVLV
jgi:hypothetical protein